MENASKALLMAAGTLIGILILSLAVYLFTSFGTTSRELHKEIDEQRIEQFNSQFTSYEGKDNITIHDVITIANLATENNIYYELTASDAGKNSSYIKVILNNTNYKNKAIQGDIDDKDKKNMYNKIISDEEMVKKIIEDEETQVLPNYECKADISDVTGKVYQVTFEKN